jgi:hypothetical protein
MAAPGKFTPVQGNVSPQGPPTQMKGSSPAIPIFLAILYAAYLGLMILGPKFVSQLADELDPKISPFLRLVGAGVLFIVFALIIVVNLLSKPKPLAPQPPRPSPQVGKGPGPKAPAGPPPSTFKPIAAKIPAKKEEPPKPQPKKVEDESAGSQVIIYPVEVEGGIFGDTYIGLSPKKVLKLRSMVVEPEYLS